MCYLLSHNDKDVQYRGVVVVKNIVGHSKELAEKLLCDEVIQVLDILTKLGKLVDSNKNQRAFL